MNLSLAHRVFLALMVVVLGLGILTACGDSNESPATPSPTPLLPLTLELDVGAAGDTGEPIPLTLVLTNTGNTVVEFGTGGEGYDAYFLVEDEGGGEVWISEDTPPILILVPVSLDPGESKVYTAEWDRRDNAENPAPEGTYHAFGRMEITTNPDGDEERFQLTTETQKIEI